MEQLEAAAERAAANRKRIVAGWITVGPTTHKHSHTVALPKPNRADRLGLGAKPEKNRQTTIANNIFAGLAARKNLTGGVVKTAKDYSKRPSHVVSDDDEDSRAKSVGKRKTG